MPDHTLSLSNAAAVEIVNLASSRGLLTKPVHIRKVSQFQRDHLLPILKRKEGFDLEAAQQPFGEFVVNEKTRDALKELVRSAAEKGALSCSMGTGEVLDLFGLAED
jgi:hypothetical protein